MQDALTEFRATYGIKITCSVEEEPLGTAGPIRLAEKYLRDSPLAENEPFFVFNSDVICEFPLRQMIKFHEAHGGEGTVCVTRVEDPSKFGVVVSDKETGRIQRFVEKPVEFISDQINAGLYLLSKKVIDRVEPGGVFQMIETDVFPQMARDGVLFSFQLEGYWADIGQPKDFLRGMKLHLASLEKKQNDPDLTPRSVLYTPATPRSGVKMMGSTILIDPSVKIGRNSVIGPNVTIGKNVEIGEGVRISNSSIFESTVVSDYAHIKDSIIGWRNRVGKWAKIENFTVTGENVVISSEIFVNGAIVLPHKSIRERIIQEGTILM